MAEPIETEIAQLRSILGDPTRDPFGGAFAPLADALRRAGRADEAHRVLDEGLERRPEFATAYLISGRLHDGQGQVDAARLAYTRVLELDPGNRLAAAALERFSRQHEVALGVGGAETAEVPGVSEASDPPEPPLTPVISVPEVATQNPAARGPVATRTLAETYARQGLVDAAIEVLERLIETSDDDDPSLRERLADLRGQGTGVPPAQTRPSAMVLSRPDVPSPSPHPESPPSEESVGDYFDRLLSWGRS